MCSKTSEGKVSIAADSMFGCVGRAAEDVLFSSDRAKAGKERGMKLLLHAANVVMQFRVAQTRGGGGERSMF